MATDYGDSLSAENRETCQSYAEWRELVEVAMFDPEITIQLSENDRNRYQIAVEQASVLNGEMVILLFFKRPPATVYLTTAALLNHE